MAGESIMFSGPADKIPAGYLIEDGAEVGRVAYATLFAAIGTTYGAGDGATTFNLPDSRGEFWRALDLSSGRDAGRVMGSKQSDSVGQHLHDLIYVPGDAGAVSMDGGSGAIAITGGSLGRNGIQSSSYVSAVSVNSGPSQTLVRNLAKIPLIKY